MDVTLDIDIKSAVQSSFSNAAGLQQLEDRIAKKEAVIGIIGLGYVGLPLVTAYAHNGFRTVGVDLNSSRVDELNRGVSYIEDIDGRDIETAIGSGLFKAHASFDVIGEADIIFICVPTPVTPHKDPDTSYIASASRSVAEHLRRGQLVILKSTTFPNTTEELVQPILKEAADKRGLVLGEDFALAFSPERVDPGNTSFDTANTPVVVGGVTENCTRIATSAIEQISDEVLPVASPRVAEMSKLLENIFRSVNIALVNELARLCDRMGGLSIWDVIDAAKTKPFGFMPFYPGPGLGGHCIPIDPYYLSWLARKYDFETSFITLSARTNEDMPFYVAEGVLRAIARQSTPLDEANVLILGVAFKKDVGDTRHSPSEKIIEILRTAGVRNISYSDPHVPAFSADHSSHSDPMISVDVDREIIEKQHVVAIITDHSDFPYELIAAHSHYIVDSRNALKDIPHDPSRVFLVGGG